MKNNVARLFKLSIVFLICLLAVACRQSPKLESVTLSADPCGRTSVPQNVSEFPPIVAVMVDVSGSMAHYRPFKGQVGVVNYVLRNMQLIWIPSVQVKRSNGIERLSVGQAFQVGTSVKKIPIGNLQNTFAQPKGSDTYTALHSAMKTVAVLLDQSNPRASMAILVSDLETDIGPFSDDCPQGNAPYCVAEQLKPLYTQDQRSKPGWWILGIKAPYAFGHKQIFRPVFVTVWSYDIEQTRKLLRKMYSDLKITYGVLGEEAQIELLEIFPADGWVPNRSAEWLPKGKMEFVRGAPLNWFEKEKSFRCSKNSMASVDFELARYSTEGPENLDTPYEQVLQPQIDSHPLRQVTVDNTQYSDKTISFRLNLSCEAVSKGRKSPHEVTITMRARPELDTKKIAWAHDWSADSEGQNDRGQIVNLESFIDGALQIASPAQSEISSCPVVLKVWK